MASEASTRVNSTSCRLARNFPDLCNFSAGQKIQRIAQSTYSCFSDRVRHDWGLDFLEEADSVAHTDFLCYRKNEEGRACFPSRYPFKHPRHETFDGIYGQKDQGF